MKYLIMVSLILLIASNAWATDIKAVFEASGFEHTRDHIEMAKPDSQDTVNDQASYYRRNSLD